MKKGKSLMMVFLFSVTMYCLGCSSSGSTELKKVVRGELELIRQMDHDTLDAMLSDTGLFEGEATSILSDSELSDAFLLFFHGFRYEIGSVHIRNESASVETHIWTPDAQALAKDYARALLREKIHLRIEAARAGEKPAALSVTDKLRLVAACQTENTYEVKKSSFRIECRRTDTGEWQIVHSSALEDGLLGGFVTCMQNPFLLTPEETVCTCLDYLIGMPEDDLYDFLDLETLLSDASQGEIASALMDQMRGCFSYEVTDSKSKGYHATVDVSLTSFDSAQILETFQTSLAAYLSTPEAVEDGESGRYEDARELLLQAIQENEATATVEVALTLRNDGSGWQMVDAGSVIGEAIFEKEGL